MFIISRYERRSLERRVVSIEMELRRLHLNDQLPAAEKLRQWKTLFQELKWLRQLNSQPRWQAPDHQAALSRAAGA